MLFLIYLVFRFDKKIVIKLIVTFLVTFQLVWLIKFSKSALWSGSRNCMSIFLAFYKTVFQCEHNIYLVFQKIHFFNVNIVSLFFCCDWDSAIISKKCQLKRFEIHLKFKCLHHSIPGNSKPFPSCSVIICSTVCPTSIASSARWILALTN